MGMHIKYINKSNQSNQIKSKIICQLQKHLTKGFLNYSSFLYINQPYLMGIYIF